MADNAVQKNLKREQVKQIASSATAFIVAVLIFAILISCDFKQTDPPPPPLPPPIISPDSLQPQLQKCKLFYFDTNSLRLASEERELVLSQDVTERLKQIITELLEDSISGLYQTIPQGTLLYEVYVDEQSTAYLDFSRHLKDERIGGTTSEALTVGAILRTVKENFRDQIRRVQILIEGLETDTIGGHVDISKPLVLALELEVVSGVAESEEAASPEAEPAEIETLEVEEASGEETDQ
jgi:hypothetical protein